METIKCEICGKEIPKEGAYQVGEDSGVFVCEECYKNKCVKCSRCGEIIFYYDAYQGFDGYLCECCHDDLFG